MSGSDSPNSSNPLGMVGAEETSTLQTVSSPGPSGNTSSSATSCTSSRSSATVSTPVRVRRETLPVLAEGRDENSVQHYVLSDEESEIPQFLQPHAPIDPHGMPPWHSMDFDESGGKPNKTAEEDCLPLLPEHDYGAHVEFVHQDSEEERVPVVTHTHTRRGDRALLSPVNCHSLKSPRRSWAPPCPFHLLIIWNLCRDRRLLITAFHKPFMYHRIKDTAPMLRIWLFSRPASTPFNNYSTMGSLRMILVASGTTSEEPIYILSPPPQ